MSTLRPREPLWDPPARGRGRKRSRFSWEALRPVLLLGLACTAVFALGFGTLGTVTRLRRQSHLKHDQRMDDARLEDELSGAAAASGGTPATPVVPHNPDAVATPVLWHAPFFSGGGYGTEAIEFVLGLRRTGLVPRLAAIQHGDLFFHEALEGLEPGKKADMLELAASVPRQAAAGAITICHSEPGAWALPEPLFQTSPCPLLPLGRCKYVIGRTMFETDRLSRLHVDRCNQMHEVWVPTRFHKEVFEHSGVDPGKLHVVGEAVDVAEFDPGTVQPLRKRLGLPAFGLQVPFSLGQPRGGDHKPHVFLSVFKWEDRKGWEVLLQAYLREFAGLGPDKAVLILKTNPFDAASPHEAVAKLRGWAWKAMPDLFPGEPGGRDGMQALERLPTVHVMPGHLPGAELRGLYRAASSFVLPSRGEGWGRPQVEAMAMALPVISTNWSGPTEYLDLSVGFPLRIDGLVEVPQGVGPFGGHKWAQPSLTHLRQLMREVYDRPSLAAAKGRAARHRMVQRYAPAVVAAQVAQRLREIEDALRRKKHG